MTMLIDELIRSATHDGPQPVELVTHRSVGDLVAATVGDAVAMFVRAWWTMLAIGGVHSAVPAVPAVGYWTVVLVFVIVSAVGYEAGIRPLSARNISPKRGSK